MNNFYKENYKILHSNKDFFWGKRTYEMSKLIGEILKFFNCKSLYDFGCGKGKQYTDHKIHKNWGLEKLYLYDVGVEEISKKPSPELKFDAVISVDVLEHIGEEDVKNEIKELLDRTNKITFLVIDTKHALKTLPNGQNAHLTVKPSKWWNDLISSYNKENKKVIVIYEHSKDDYLATFNLSKDEEKEIKKLISKEYTSSV